MAGGALGLGGRGVEGRPVPTSSWTSDFSALRLLTRKQGAKAHGMSKRVPLGGSIAPEMPIYPPQVISLRPLLKKKRQPLTKVAAMWQLAILASFGGKHLLLGLHGAVPRTL